VTNGGYIAQRRRGAEKTFLLLKTLGGLAAWGGKMMGRADGKDKEIVSRRGAEAQRRAFFGLKNPLAACRLGPRILV